MNEARGTYDDSNDRRLYIDADEVEQRVDGEEDDVHDEDRGVEGGGLEEDSDQTVDSVAGIAIEVLHRAPYPPDATGDQHCR